jgi:hypothetical protein
MTQGDETMRPLGGHDAGEPRSSQHVAFHRITLKNDIERFFAHQNAPFSYGDALGCPLFGDVDHAGLAALVDMG